jgi:tRNA A37 methylthiotransferase MiaB
MTAFHITDKSCYRRREEISTVRRFLLANGWTEAVQLDQADLALFFGCAGLRFLVEETISEIIETRRTMKPGAELIVGGCLPGMDGQRLREIHRGRILTPSDLSALNELPNVTAQIESMPRIWGAEALCQQWKRPGVVQAVRMRIDHAALASLRLLLACHPWPGLKRAAVKLQRRDTVSLSIAAGCGRRCAYCAKPFASGNVRSKPLDVVVRDISEGIRLGYRCFDLYADSIGNYGLDLQVNLGDLLDRLLALNKRFSVGLFDLHPQDFIRYFDAVETLCEYGKLHYLYVAVQSGNERVLKLMRRPCSVGELETKLLAIRRHHQVFMQSGIIAGFPGETDEEFEDTLRLLERVEFDDVYVHHYCDMPNTEASGLSGKADRAVMQRRLEAVRRACFRHNTTATEHEWRSNLAFDASTQKSAPPTPFQALGNREG